MTDETPPAVLKVLDKFVKSREKHGLDPFNYASWETYCSWFEGKAHQFHTSEYERLATLAFKAGREFERKQAEPQEPPDKGDMDGRD